jgi:hypothetical protein
MERVVEALLADLGRVSRDGDSSRRIGAHSFSGLLAAMSELSILDSGSPGFSMTAIISNLAVRLKQSYLHEIIFVYMRSEALNIPENNTCTLTHA